MNVDPRHLMLVLAIVEHGTFNRAAAALGISQPALSKAIALLEHRLGAKLFERGARGSSLTQTGRIIARNAHNLDRLLAQVQEEIAANARGLDGPITIGATPSMMIGMIPETIARLARMQPETVITIIEGLDDRLSPMLDRGDIDLLVGPVGGLHPTPDGITELKLADDPFLIAMAPDHRLATSRELALADLAEEAWVLPTPGSSFYRMIEALFLGAGMAWPRNHIATNSLQTHERLVATTGRIAIATRAQLMGRDASVRTIALARAPMRAIGVRRRTDTRLPPLADLFIDQLKEVTMALEC